MANSYMIGTLVRMSATFSVSGTNTDPGTVTAQIKDPNAAITVLTTVKDSVGVYHADFTTVLAGAHYYRFVGTTGLTVSGEGSFVVTPSKAS